MHTSSHCSIFCLLLLLGAFSIVRAQFPQLSSLGGGGDGSSSSSSSSGYPRIKLAGPLGQLIGGQGISLNSGLGQVLSSLISNAAGVGAGGSNSASSGSGSGSTLQQLATAASTTYMNAIRATLPQFAQAVGQTQQQPQSPQQQLAHGPPRHHMSPHHHHQFGQHGGAHMYGSNPLSFMSAEPSGMYGAQPNFDPSHFNGFTHFQGENFFNGAGGMGGGQFGHAPFGQFGQSSNLGPMASSAYHSGPGYNRRLPAHQGLDK